ncbi:amino acid adenylation domain-containing protein [Cronbergia sp. UHCC 0137]|uniref:non-ribosomal peptide synthetase n=1 Tax=Cronbergia sp. UHCC 0137 TaxID=3110239 RepID=UPI002B2022D4|nr:non-ribosomal peptide synthetase [Cronbergia sp. UHCC 0137]MEA5617994.1 amino acid adenylation domain-containing protein [Cronbergia sp. UHCC 0137]
MTLESIEQRIAKLSPEKRQILSDRLRQQTQIKSHSIPPREPGSPCLASFAQKRFWFVQQLTPNSSVYNNSKILKFEQPVNISALNMALQAIIDRHEVLRTTFDLQDGELYQIIDEKVSIELPIIDLCGACSKRSYRPEALQDLIKQEIERPFNLSADIPFRNILFCLNEKEYILLIVVHHIASDHWSSEIIINELHHLYQAFFTGNLPSLPNLSIQYADFAQWQRNWLKGDVLESQLSYWKQKLSGILPVLELPTDYPRPQIQTYHGASISIELSQDLSNYLKALSQYEGVTLFMTLLAAFQILLHRYSGQEDIIIGIPIANRNRQEIEPLIGAFINNLVLRTDLGGNPSFQELLKRVREVTLGAYTHQDLPFEKLVEELQVNRDLSRDPLFQVRFNMSRLEENNPVLSRLKVEPILIPEVNFLSDLTIYTQEKKHGIELKLVYKTDLFAPARMREMLYQFELLLIQIVAEPEKPIQSYSLITANSQALLPNPSQTISEREYQPITNIFTDWATQTPKQPAIIQNQQIWTYQELAQASTEIAQILITAKIEKGDVVAVSGVRSFGLIASMLGVLMSGGVLLNIDLNLPLIRQELMLSTAVVKTVLFISEETKHSFADSLLTISINPDTGKASLNSSANTPVRVTLSPDDSAYIFFTSGTTGIPKGILGCHKGLSHFLHWQRSTFAITPQDRVAQLTGLSFDVVIRDIFLPLISGATLCLPDADDDNLSAMGVLPWLESQQISLIHTVPTLILSWLMDVPKGISLRSLRLLFSAGEPLTDKLIKQWRTVFPESGQIVNLYGPTETTLAKCYYSVPVNPLPGVQPVGSPLPETQALVFTPNSQLSGIGEVGEIVLRTPYRTKGYINADPEQLSKFVKNPFRDDDTDLLYYTGDRGRYGLDGTLEILGRIDQQVKIRGVRIELGEIEAVLNQHSDILNTVAIAREDIPGDKRLIAYIVPQLQATLTQSELRQFLKQKLPEYMIPSAFVILEKLPLTPNGKIDRRALPAPQQNLQELEETFVAPRNELEQKLAIIWEEILKIQPIGIKDNFFELGGHSLLATQVNSRIQKAFAIETPLKYLFEAPTIAQFSQLIQADNSQLSAVFPLLKPIKRTEKLPLSSAQIRMWFLNQLEPEKATYNISLVLRLEGQLNKNALEKALQTIVERHETLRTSFISIDGSPVQIINPSLQITLSVIDLTELVGFEIQKQVEELAQTETNKAFDLTVSPLFRVKILQLKENSHILLLTFHHIITDGWSMRVFQSELSTLYQDFNQGKSPSLFPLPIQYADFAHWQRNWLQGEVLARQLHYWKTQLANIPPILELPTDKPRPNIQTYQGKSHKFQLSAELSQNLNGLSNKSNVTLFMTLLSAFAVLLYRYSHQEDIVIGSPIANRNRQEIEQLIGFFVNTLALRINVLGNSSFQEILTRVKQICLDAYSHQELPFEKLVEELQPERNLSQSPIFQVMFVLQNTLQQTINLTDIKIESIKLERQTSKFDLTLSLTETPDGLSGKWEYSTDLFDDATIQRMSRHFQVLLGAIVANPNLEVSKLRILTEREKNQLLVEWNNTVVKYPDHKSIHQLFEEQAEIMPENIAVAFEDQELTYQELNHRANQLAHYLQKLGVKPEVLVGIYVGRSLEMIIGLLGILKAGGAYVPLDSNYPQERLAFMLADTQAPILLTQQSLVNKLPASKTHIICLDTDWEKISNQSQDNLTCNAIADNLAYITYTSGSTGQSKGVCTIHRGVVRLVKNINYANLTQKQTFLQLAPISFDASTFEIWGSLLNGGKLIIFPAHIPSLVELGQAIQRYQITTLWLTTGLFYLMVDERLEDLKPLHQLLVGGDVLSISHVQKFRQKINNCHLINGYGPTENTTFTCCYLIPQLPQQGSSISIGGSITNTQVYILDSYLQPVPVGVFGELYTGGDGLARGYLNQPELTTEKFIPNPFGSGKIYKTGDIVRYLADGNIEFIGRVDNQVKIRGFRIELGEIEVVLSEHPHILNVIVIAREDIPGDKRLIAYIVTQPQATLTQSELRQFLKQKLPEYMIPSAFVILEKFPLTPNGKIDRRALPIPEQIRREPEETFIAPRNELEQQLTKAWEAILGIKPIGVKDNFFALGGHSLLAVKLFAQIEKTFKINIPLAAIFHSPTIEQLADMINSQEWKSPWYSLVPLQPKGSRPILFGIHHIYFQNLIRNLGEEQPVYALHYGISEPKDKALSLPKMEDLAAHYIEEMRSLQPEGPYFLMGLSVGGLIAYEMAQQLVAQGQEVALLALFDTFLKRSNVKLLPLSQRLKLLWNLGFWEFWLRLQFQIKTKFNRLLARYFPKTNVTEPIQSQYFPHTYTDYPIQLLRNAYTLKSYSGKVVLFKAINSSSTSSVTYSFDPPELAWQKLVDGELVIHNIPGNHISILDEPNVKILAEKLTHHIDHD